MDVVSYLQFTHIYTHTHSFTLSHAGEGEEEKLELRCIVMLQKETPEGLIDEECGQEVAEGHGGICE